MNDREILFRGKRKDNGEWVEGYYAVVGVRHIIIKKQSEYFYALNADEEQHGNEIIEVDLETVGRYIGLTDKNGTKIFEKDIVIANNHPDVVADDEYATIKYDTDSARFVIEFSTFEMDFDSCFEKDVEVIGNIHDNSNFL